MSNPLPTFPPLSLAALAGAMLHRDRRPASGDEQREIARLGIQREGPDYGFDGYHYQELDDAVAYARIARSRTEGSEPGMRLRRPPIDAPTQDELAVMATHGIQFDGRGFRFAGFRYDRLIDAVRQSRRSGQGCE